MPNNPVHPNLLVIRHAETQWNAEGRLQGSNNDSPLTLDGIRQALAIAATVSSHLPDTEGVHLWVSPLGRARQTASILADVWKLPFELFQVEPMLAERAYGKWEGYTLGEVAQTFPEGFRRQQADPWGYHIPGGESRDQFTRRVFDWLSSLDNSLPHVAIVHSGCLRALRGIYTRDDPDQILEYREPQTTAYWLSGSQAHAIEVDPAVLRILGHEGQGRTVSI